MEKKSDLPHVSEEILNRIGKKFLKLGVYTFFATLVIIFLYIVKNDIKRIDDYIETRKGLISNLVSAGDSFQLRREIGAIVDSGIATKVLIIEEHEESVIVIASSLQATSDNTKTYKDRIYFKNAHLFKESIFPLDYRGSTAKIVANIEIPIFRFLIIAGIFGAVLYAFWFYLKSEFRKSSQTIVGPIEQLANYFSADLILKDGSAGKPNWLQFSEIENVFVNFNLILNELKRSKEKNESLIKEKIFLEIAKQVAHDIRSPLAALEVVADGSSFLESDNKILLKKSIVRLKDISNMLLSNVRTSRDLGDVYMSETNDGSSTFIAPQNTEFLPPALEEIISEKRVQYRDRANIELDLSIDFNYVAYFSFVNLANFKVIISNLVDNAIESIEQNSGRVLVRLEISERDKIKISIVDNGKGIPRSIIPLIGKKGATFNKTNGNGLGLFHAMECVKCWGGEIEVISTEIPHVSHGTTIQITLPKRAAPAWFASQILIPRETTIFALDDDPSVLQIWKNRFIEVNLKFKSNIDLRLHTTVESLILSRSLITENKNFCYLFDFDLGETSISGADALVQLGDFSYRYLVTSKFEDKAVIEAALTNNFKIIPKLVCRHIPIGVC